MFKAEHLLSSYSEWARIIPTIKSVLWKQTCTVQRLYVCRKQGRYIYYSKSAKFLSLILFKNSFKFGRSRTNQNFYFFILRGQGVGKMPEKLNELFCFQFTLCPKGAWLLKLIQSNFYLCLISFPDFSCQTSVFMTRNPELTLFYLLNLIISFLKLDFYGLNRCSDQLTDPLSVRFNDQLTNHLSDRLTEIRTNRYPTQWTN